MHFEKSGKEKGKGKDNFQKIEEGEREGEGHWWGRCKEGLFSFPRPSFLQGEGEGKKGEFLQP